MPNEIAVGTVPATSDILAGDVPKIWRIRISYDGSRPDLAKVVWDSNRVGVW